MNTNPVASLIETHAHEIAGLAWQKLQTEYDDIGERFGPDAEALWTDHLQQRLLELSVALNAGDNKLFAARLAWSQSAMQARGLTPADIEKSLTALSNALSSQLDDSDARIARQCIDQAGQSITDEPALMSRLDPGLPNHRLALQYIQTVVAGNVLPGMALIMDAVEHGLSIQDAYLHVLLPAQAEVGRLWHLNIISVSEEHLVSYTTQRLMATLASQAEHKPDNGYTAVAGAVVGNVHDIGIRAIAYLLEIEGWRTIYLGSDIPQNELPNTLDSYDADVLLLSVALTSQIPDTTRTIESVRQKCTGNTKVLVGGNGLSESPELWRKTGADGYAIGADQALSLAAELAAQK